MSLIMPVFSVEDSDHRLWPLSRECIPKHLLSLVTKRQVLERIMGCRLFVLFAKLMNATNAVNCGTAEQPARHIGFGDNIARGESEFSPAQLNLAACLQGS